MNSKAYIVKLFEQIEGANNFVFEGNVIVRLFSEPFSVSSEAIVFLVDITTTLRTKLGFRKIKILSTFHPNNLETNHKIYHRKIFVPYGIYLIVKYFLLNQVRANHRLAHAWFLEIDPVRIVSMRVCVCVCLCLRLLITSGII